jgi:hypothetical protein
MSSVSSRKRSSLVISCILNLYFLMILMKQLALIKFLSAATIVCAADVPITQDELVRRTQELYDSLVSGNQAPWKKHFADDCMFADEKGRFFAKAKLIADITPLPAGYSGTIKVENAQSRIIGNTAIFGYDADETETIFGQNLKARYHITDTWLQRNCNWQIIASQAHRYYEDPTVGKLTRKSLPTSSARTNWRLAKQDRSPVKMISYSLKGMARRNNCYRKHQSFSSAKVSKAEFCSVTPLTVKSTR